MPKPYFVKSLRKANFQFLAYLKVWAAMFSSFSASIRILARKYTKYWNVSPKRFYDQNHSSRVYEKRIFVFWLIWRSEHLCFPMYYKSISASEKGSSSKRIWKPFWMENDSSLFIGFNEALERQFKGQNRIW